MSWQIQPFNKFVNGKIVLDKVKEPSQPYERSFWVDSATQERYRPDTELMLRIKFAAILAIGLPLFAAYLTVWHVVNIALKFFRAEGMAHVKSLATLPFYVMEGATSALYGLFDPLNGRKYFAALEKKWLGVEDPERMHCCKVFNCVEENRRLEGRFVQFLAPCMQIESDPRYVTIQTA